MTARNRRGEAGPKPRIQADVAAQMGEAERHVTRFVLRRKPAHLARHRIGRVFVQEPEQRQARALAEHRQQEKCQREIRLFEQRLQRFLAAGGRKTHVLAYQQRAAREAFDVARLVRRLDGEKLQHFAKMRMDLREKTRGHDQRRGFVLDQKRHHLDDGVFDFGRMRDRRVPVNGGRRIPLCGRGLRVQRRSFVRPDHVFVGEREIKRRAPELDTRAPCRQAPPGSRSINDRSGQRSVGRAGSHGIFPSPGLGRPPHHEGDRPRAAFAREQLDLVALSPAPSSQMHRKFDIRSENLKPGADRKLRQRPFQQEMRASVETKRA